MRFGDVKAQAVGGRDKPDHDGQSGVKTTMPMKAEDIETMIRAALPDAEIEIRDLAGDGDHYAATITSAAFKGLTRVRQHQMVYDALKGNMGGVLHALALTTVVKA
jgi:stress-induced morphogen